MCPGKPTGSSLDRALVGVRQVLMRHKSDMHVYSDTLCSLAAVSRQHASKL